MFLNRLIRLAWIPLLFASAQLAPAQDAVCTLADHIRTANTNSAVGFCPAGTSHDIITIAEDITLSEPLPPITGTITIEGGGHTISGNGKYQIFDVNGGRLTINSLTLSLGYAEFSGLVPTGGGGGAILLRNGAEATINRSVFARNYSGGGGGGGAIAVLGGQLAVNDSSFSNNSARANGGAIYFRYGSGKIANSRFLQNRTRPMQIGGAIFVGTGVELEVTNSTFYGNSGGHGGALVRKFRRPAASSRPKPR